MPERRAPENLDALLRSLREEGVDRARREGAEIVAAAQGQAAVIRRQAEVEAAALIEQCRSRILEEEAAARSALARAARDVLLAARADLITRLRGLMEVECRAALDSEGLCRLILQLATVWSTGGYAQPIELLLSPDDLARLGDTALTRLRGALGVGLTVRVDATARRGFRLRASVAGVEIESGEAALAEAFATALGPRFAALFDSLRGAVPS